MIYILNVEIFITKSFESDDPIIVKYDCVHVMECFNTLKEMHMYYKQHLDNMFEALERSLNGGNGS